MVEAGIPRHEGEGEFAAILLEAFEGSHRTADLVRSGGFVYSHASAARLLDLALAFPLEPTVSLTRPGRRYRGRNLDYYGTALPDPEDCVVVDGRSVTAIARTCVDMTLAHGLRIGLPMAEAALHSEKCSREDLLAAVGRHPQGEKKVVRTLLELASDLSESVGESLVKLNLFHLGRWQEWEQQVRVTAPHGWSTYAIDFVHRATRTALEMDGYGKYTVDGGDGAESIRREKRRDMDLRALGWNPVHVDWRTVCDIDAFRRVLFG